MTTHGNGNGRGYRITLAVSLTLAIVAIAMYLLGESPLTAQRRIEAVNVLMRELSTLNASLAELRGEVAGLKHP